MDEQAMVSEITRLLEDFEVQVKVRNLEDSELSARSGMVRVRGEAVVYLHHRLDLVARIDILVDALRGFDLSDVFVSPALREMLDQEEE